jgi:hypothetical protein
MSEYEAAQIALENARIALESARNSAEWWKAGATGLIALLVPVVAFLLGIWQGRLNTRLTTAMHDQLEANKVAATKEVEDLKAQLLRQNAAELKQADVAAEVLTTIFHAIAVLDEMQGDFFPPRGVDGNGVKLAASAELERRWGSFDTSLAPKLRTCVMLAAVHLGEDVEEVMQRLLGTSEKMRGNQFRAMIGFMGGDGTLTASAVVSFGAQLGEALYDIEEKARALLIPVARLQRRQTRRRKT